MSATARSLKEEFQGLQTDSIVLGMQLWHLVAIIIVGICILLAVVCCFLDWRIPRTRKEIELDRQLRKMADQYAEQMMDKMKLEESQLDAHVPSPVKPVFGDASANIIKV